MAFIAFEVIHAELSTLRVYCFKRPFIFAIFGFKGEAYRIEFLLKFWIILAVCFNGILSNVSRPCQVEGPSIYDKAPNFDWLVEHLILLNFDKIIKIIINFSYITVSWLSFLFFHIMFSGSLAVSYTLF